MFGPATHGHQQDVGLELLAVLQVDRHRVGGLVDAGELRADLVVDLPLAELPLELLGEELVLVGHQVGQGLDDRDLGAEAAPHARELDADDAAAEHDHAVGHVVEVDRLGRGQHPAAELEPGQRLGVRAGGQHDVAAGVALPVDLDGVGADERAVAVDHGDLAGLHQSLQALVELADDAVLVGVDAAHVDARQRALDADLLTLAGVVGDLGGVQQRLGGDAAAVQAGTAQLVLLDEGHREAQLGRAQRAGVPAGTPAQDQDVVGVALAQLSLLPRRCVTSGGPVGDGGLRTGHSCPDPLVGSDGQDHPSTAGKRVPGCSPGRRAQPWPATSASTAARVRTGSPVPPFGV